jgi:hypothetical protein
MKKNLFKEFLKESGSTYLIVAIVLLAIGLFFTLTTKGNIIIDMITIGLGVCGVISITMLIEYNAWKKRK